MELYKEMQVLKYWGNNLFIIKVQLNGCCVEDYPLNLQANLLENSGKLECAYPINKLPDPRVINSSLIDSKYALCDFNKVYLQSTTPHTIRQINCNQATSGLPLSYCPHLPPLI